jgi:hypothetical protein
MNNFTTMAGRARKVVLNEREMEAALGQGLAWQDDYGGGYARAYCSNEEVTAVAIYDIASVPGSQRDQTMVLNDAQLVGLHTVLTQALMHRLKCKTGVGVRDEER